MAFHTQPQCSLSEPKSQALELLHPCSCDTESVLHMCWHFSCQHSPKNKAKQLFRWYLHLAKCCKYSRRRWEIDMLIVHCCKGEIWASLDFGCSGGPEACVPPNTLSGNSETHAVFVYYPLALWPQHRRMHPSKIHDRHVTWSQVWYKVLYLLSNWNLSTVRMIGITPTLPWGMNSCFQADFSLWSFENLLPPGGRESGLLTSWLTPLPQHEEGPRELSWPGAFLISPSDPCEQEIKPSA